MKLTDKVAIVTGSGSGIGRSVVLRFAKEGARCVVADIQKGLSESVNSEIHKLGGESISVQMDIRNQKDIDISIDLCLKHFGRIDILFNNAGIFDMEPFLESSRQTYNNIFNTNVKGMLFMMKAVAIHMVTRKIKGKIINLSSQAGHRGDALVSHYCASKAAVISYTQSAALALAKYSINVNAIAPGLIDTSMWELVDRLYAKYENLEIGEKKKSLSETVPLGRMGRPKDIEGSAVFLASNDSDYITGQTLNVDGGNWMS